MTVDGPLYPVNLRVQGKRCLVIGGGRVASAKVSGLVEAGAIVEIVAPVISDAIRAMADRGESVTWQERTYRPGDADGYWLVVTATDDAAVNRAVLSDGDRHQVWVNSADDPANCSFTLPARLRQGPLLVTFSTSGSSPAVSTWLRRRYAEEFGPEYATLIELLAEERGRIRAEGRPSEGLNWQGALDSGMLDLIREGNLAEAKERLQACLSSSSD